MGWIANLLIFLGTWLVGRKDRRAFIYTAAGEAVWTGVAVTRGMVDLAVVCAVFGIIMACWNYRKWGAAALDDIELLMKESKLNHSGLYLRNDLYLREGETWAAGCEEGYSLVTFHGPEGFEREAVYGGTRKFAINRAYDEFILRSLV